MGLTLGGLGIAGFVADMKLDFNGLQQSLDKYENRLKVSDTRFIQLEKSQAKLIEAANEVDEIMAQARDEKLVELDQQIDTRLAHTAEELDRMKNELVASISNLQPRDFIEFLKDGKSEIRVGSIVVENTSGKPIFDVRSDSGGDGALKLYADDGSIRYSILLGDDRPYVNFYNPQGDAALSLGIYRGGSIPYLSLLHNKNKQFNLSLTESGSAFSEYLLEGKTILTLGSFNDTKHPFVRFFDIDSHNKTIEIMNVKNGGRYFMYDPSDQKQIVYLGPEENQRFGFLKVSDQNGKSADYTPNKTK